MGYYLLLIAITAYCTHPLTGNQQRAQIPPPGNDGQQQIRPPPPIDDGQQQIRPPPPIDGQQTLVFPPIGGDSKVPPGDGGQQILTPILPPKGGDDYPKIIHPPPVIDYLDYGGSKGGSPKVPLPPKDIYPPKGGTKGEHDDDTKGKIPPPKGGGDDIEIIEEVITVPPPPSVPPKGGEEGERKDEHHGGEAPPPHEDHGEIPPRYVYHSGSVNFSIGTHVSTDGGSYYVQCNRNEDCYGLYEPMSWCKPGENNYWTQHGCFCDMKLHLCVIERFGSGFLQFTECRPKDYICGDDVGVCVC